MRLSSVLRGKKKVKTTIAASHLVRLNTILDYMCVCVCDTDNTKRTSRQRKGKAKKLAPKSCSNETKCHCIFPHSPTTTHTHRRACDEMKWRRVLLFSFYHCWRQNFSRFVFSCFTLARRPCRSQCSFYGSSNESSSWNKRIEIARDRKTAKAKECSKKFVQTKRKWLRTRRQNTLECIQMDVHQCELCPFLFFAYRFFHCFVYFSRHFETNGSFQASNKENRLNCIH